MNSLRRAFRFAESADTCRVSCTGNPLCNFVSDTRLLKTAAFTLAGADARQIIRHCEGATAQHIIDDYRLKITRHCEEQSDEAIHTKTINRLLHYVRNDVKRTAFTLAEVLTTLVIIGVIAAITVPILNATVSDHILEKQQKVFERKFDQNMHVMQLKGELAKPYTSTMDFVDTMKKYMNITKVCDATHLSECFAPMIMQNTRQVKFTTDKKIPLSGNAKTAVYMPDNLKTAGFSFSEDANDTELVGIVFADGVNAIVAHDHSCIVSDKFNQTADVSYCLSLYYDVNGSEGPNIIDQDVLTMNVGSKALKIGTPFISSTATIDQCEDYKREGAPITYCEVNNDYWANAAYQCFKAGGHLPSRQEMKEIATRLYGQPVSLSSSTGGLTVKDEKLWDELGKPTSVHFWTSEEISGSNAHIRYFTTTSTDVDYHFCCDYKNYRYHAMKAFCILDNVDK